MFCVCCIMSLTFQTLNSCCSQMVPTQTICLHLQSPRTSSLMCCSIQEAANLVATEWNPAFVSILATSCECVCSSFQPEKFQSFKKTNNKQRHEKEAGLPDTTQVNFTLLFSDTALDFSVVSKDGCMSSVSWAMTLHNVLLEGNTVAL